MTDEPRLTSLAHGGGCGCKLAPDVLSDILGGMPSGLMPKALLVDAATSDDAAVYQINAETAIVATTDFFMPIVDDPFDFGRIAATNAISDVYAMGATPIFSLALVGMPVGKISTLTIQKILDGGRSVAQDAGAPVAGGHSIDSVEPIYGLVALGILDPRRILRNCDGRAGDVLILGKPLGVGIFSAALKNGALAAEDYRAMIDSATRLNTPGARLGSIAGVHAVTDVTGFGLLGHLAEVCRGSGLGAVVDRASVPVFEGARRLALEGVRTGASGRNWRGVSAMIDPPAAFSEAERDILCDPQTSGGLLVSCAPEAADAVLALFRRSGHADAAIIGALSDGPPRIRFR